MAAPAPTLTARAWIDFGLLALIWGASFLTVRVALDELGVLTIVAHRVFWAALLLWAVVLWRGKNLPRSPKLWLACLVMGALNNAIPFTLLAWGQQFIESGLSAIFNATTAVFGVLVAAIVFRDERLTPSRSIGVILAFLGVVLAIGVEALAGIDIRSTAQIATLGAALSYAIAGAWARTHLSALAPEIAAAGMLTGSSLILVPLAVFVEGGPLFPQMPQTLASVGYLSILGTAIAYLLYYRIMATAGSGNTMLVTLLIPPIAIVLGWAVLGEQVALSALIGFFILAVGLLILAGRLKLPLRRQSD